MKNAKDATNIKKRVKNKKHGGEITEVLNNAYTASASVGRIMSWLQLFGGICGSILCLVIGILIIKNSTSYDSKTIATITEAKCAGSGNSSSCTLVLSYTVNGNKLTGNIIANGVYNAGQSISIKYTSSNPQNITTDSISPRFIGWFFIILSIVILIGTGIWFYIVQKNDTIAAASGVGSTAGIAVNAFDSFDSFDSGADNNT